MVFDPEKVVVFVKRSNITDSTTGDSFTNYEHVKGDANITLTGTVVTFVGDYADSGHANYVGNAGTEVLVYAQPDETNITLENLPDEIYEECSSSNI